MNKLLDRKKQLKEKRAKEAKLKELEAKKELLLQKFDKKNEAKNEKREGEIVKVEVETKIEQEHDDRLEGIKKNLIRISKEFKRGLYLGWKWFSKELSEKGMAVFEVFFRKRYFWVLLVGFVGLVLNINKLFYRFGIDEIEVGKRNLSFYPSSIRNKLKLSELVFEAGDQALANELLAMAEKEGGDSGFWQGKIKETKDYLSIPQKKEALINKISNSGVPYSWQVVLKKAELEAELFQQEELNETLDLVYWLNPQLEIGVKEKLKQ